ncbi:MAG: hypothetical protein RLY21_2036 [Planctomycetota bacterium]
MTPPRPEDHPANASEDRIDLLADAPSPPKREVPIRPKELDLPRPDPEAATQLPTPAVPARPPASRGPNDAEQAADGPVLCPRCKYDLRGRPGGARCPECGTVIQGRVRIALRPGERRSARDSLFDAWQRLAGSSLASVVLASPLVYMIPMGVAIATCTGFGPAFRVVSLRAFDQLPGPLRDPDARSLGLWRKLEQTQVVIAALITVGGLLSTVGIVGPHALPLYCLALTVWWALAATTMMLQLRVGDRLSRVLVDPSVLPFEVVPKIMRWLRITAIAGVVGGALAAYGSIRLAGGTRPPFANAAGNAWPLIILATMVGQIVVSLHARAHAVLVANCFFESDYFRANPNLRKQNGLDAEGPEEESPDAVPAAKRHSFTPKGDDAPIRLPGE